MKFSKTIPTSIFAMILLIGIGTITVSAQEQSKDKPSERPVVVYYYYDPFMAWDRWWYDPYRNDPFLRERRELYYHREAVRDARSELNEHLREYKEDGVITAEERRELDDDYADLNEALGKLEEYRIEEGYIRNNY